MDIVTQFSPQWLGQWALRLLAACVLAGAIGYEREFASHKPAGFRTHILVGLGAALVMMTSEFAMRMFPAANMDPTRIGAQVVSGIGFLGAGAILRSGFTVKGLTTAASLWAVACVGIACGIGFYAGALLATALVLAVLTLLKVFEEKLERRGRETEFQVEARSGMIVIGEIQRILGQHECAVRELHVEDGGPDAGQQIRCVVVWPKGVMAGSRVALLTASIQAVEGVVRVHV